MSTPANLDGLKQLVRNHDASRPRSLQKRIGPSDVGTPCARRLMYRLVNVDPVNTDSDPWAAIVGTAVHEWLRAAADAENERLGRDRYLTEVKVTLPGYMTGSADLVDLDTNTVIDHKVVGAAALKRVKAGAVSEQYRTQLHIYGLGLQLAGVPIEHVAIAYWSRSGALKDALFWTEPINHELVEAALRRLDALKELASLGPAALPLVPTADAFCLYCPHYLPAATDLETACPGHQAEPNPTQGATP